MLLRVRLLTTVCHRNGLRHLLMRCLEIARIQPRSCDKELMTACFALLLVPGWGILHEIVVQQYKSPKNTTIAVYFTSTPPAGPPYPPCRCGVLI